MNSKTNKTNQRIHCITEGAIMIALSVVLEMVCHWLNEVTGIEALLPFGGTITVGMIPIVYYSYRRGVAWGVGVGFTYSLLQVVLGHLSYLPKDFGSLMLCLLLDYVIAFTILGVADLFAKPFGKKRLVGYCFGAIIVCIVRFVSSYLSGVILWGSYAPEGMNVWLYSLIYNGSYMLPNTILTAMFIVIICASLDPKTLRPMKKKQTESL
jgi:thiamine transporter